MQKIKIYEGDGKARIFINDLELQHVTKYVLKREVDSAVLSIDMHLNPKNLILDFNNDWNRK